jgi:hypothetical protein
LDACAGVLAAMKDTQDLDLVNLRQVIVDDVLGNVTAAAARTDIVS